VSRSSSGTVTELPSGSMLEIGCPVTDCEFQRLRVVLPDSGKVASLATQPPGMTVMSVMPVPDANGTWWVYGTNDDRTEVSAASRDNGRTWVVGKFPSFHTFPATQISAVAAPDGVYTIVMERTTADQFRLATIFRTTDGGHTWRPTWEETANPLTYTTGRAEVRADGALVLQSGQQILVSTDGGRTLRPDDSRPPGEWTRAGYVAVEPDGTYQLAGVAGKIPRP
jgi:hypothetical protein